MASVVAMLVLLAPASSAAATSANELFADGNRLFRDDLYWAALLRYREAGEAGMDSPILHYNTGVAHYRAGQHARARDALRRSAKFTPLAPISHYNLGLNAYAIGDFDQALEWFRRARDQRSANDISRLARRALAELRKEIDAASSITVMTNAVKRERRFTKLDLRVRIGAGIDDNVFRSPAMPYIDLANAAQPLVTPDVQTGIYVPFSLRARFRVNSLENEGFFASYRFGGRFYQDKNLENANELLQEIAFGSEYHRKDEDSETRLYSAFKIAQHDETYYDPDNGIGRDAGGVDISDRLSYLRYGPEFWMRKRYGALTLGARTKGQLWNYEDTEAVPEYDHEFWAIGISGQYRFTQSSLLRLTADYYTRRFGDRPSFELDGTQPLDNTTVRYDYSKVGIEARQRITEAMWFSVEYARTEREDRHVSYNSYVRDEYGAAIRFRFGQRFDLEASGRYYIYDYDNAFAFHEPAAGRKTLETFRARVIATYKMTKQLKLVAEYSLRNVDSNDTRIAYRRGQAILALRWSQ